MDSVVEMFATNIATQSEANLVAIKLLELIPGARINFDLEDCDNILRIEHVYVPIADIERFVAELGFHCQLWM